MMNVVNKKEDNRTRFADLVVGDVYYDEEEQICIKTKLAEEGPNCIYFDYTNTWTAGHECSSTSVLLVEADLVIK